MNFFRTWSLRPLSADPRCRKGCVSDNVVCTALPAVFEEVLVEVVPSILGLRRPPTLFGDISEWSSVNSGRFSPHLSYPFFVVGPTRRQLQCEDTAHVSTTFLRGSLSSTAYSEPVSLRSVCHRRLAVRRPSCRGKGTISTQL
jgi:hypothetical protein